MEGWWIMKIVRYFHNSKRIFFKAKMSNVWLLSVLKWPAPSFMLFINSLLWILGRYQTSHMYVVSVLSKKEQYWNDAILFLITHMTCYIHTCLVVSSRESTQMMPFQVQIYPFICFSSFVFFQKIRIFHWLSIETFF